MNECKKIFVHDTIGIFSKFIKNNFIKQIEIDFCQDERNFNDKFVGDYIASFVVINRLEDLLVFSYCCEIKKTHVFVITRFKGISDMLSKFENIYILDISTAKQEILNAINFHLDMDRLNQD